jgi:hypothetical protein
MRTTSYVYLATLYGINTTFSGIIFARDPRKKTWLGLRHQYIQEKY